LKLINFGFDDSIRFDSCRIRGTDLLPKNNNDDASYNIFILRKCWLLDLCRTMIKTEWK